MMPSYRTLQMQHIGTRVQIYRNLTKGCWSVRDAKTKLVIGHAATAVLRDANFKVSEAGRQRVLRERRKNVHAWVEGILEPAETTLHVGEWVTYNPYKAACFQLVLTGDPVMAAPYAVFTSTGKVFEAYTPQMAEELWT